MVDKVLAAFIKDNLNKGYTIFAIRQHLLEQGYADSAVNEAIDYIYNPVQKHEIHLSKAAMALIIILALLLAATSYFVFFYQQEPAQLLDITLTAKSEKSVQPGSDFNFQYDLTNMGSKRTYDIAMTFELVGRDDKNVIDTYQKTVALETTVSNIETITIPKTAPLGQYFVRATAKYKAQEATSSIGISITQPSLTATCTDGVQNQGETGIDCGGPCKPCETCSDSIKDQNEEGIDCGGVCPPCAVQPTTPTTPVTGTTQPEEQRPSWEILDNIKQEALNDTALALKDCEKQAPDIKEKCLLNLEDMTGNRDYCNDISLTSRKDSCISVSASKNNQSDFCKDIVSDSMRDQCYMNFILNTDDPQYLCEELINPSLKRACEGLRMARSATQAPAAQ